jgi:hypothetical protein
MSTIPHVAQTPCASGFEGCDGRMGGLFCKIVMKSSKKMAVEQGEKFARLKGREFAITTCRSNGEFITK